MSTGLKEVRGRNDYCLPSAISAITGESTDAIASWIKAWRNNLRKDHKFHQVRGAFPVEAIAYLTRVYDLTHIRYWCVARKDVDWPSEWGGSDDPHYYLTSYQRIDRNTRHSVAVCRGMAADSFYRTPIDRGLFQHSGPLYLDEIWKLGFGGTS